MKINQSPPQRHPYHTSGDEAEPGPAALKIWQQHRDRIRLVFTDIIMSENVNGIDLGRQLLTDKPSPKSSAKIWTTKWEREITGGNRDKN